MLLAAALGGLARRWPGTPGVGTRARAPASFADHLSQVRLVWRSMTPVEKEHIVAAYSFELGKVYEQVIKERQLRALANIDPELCAQVSTGVGLPAPEPSESLDDGVAASPALSQPGDVWPTDGPQVGIVADAEGSLDGVQDVRRAVLAAGMVPLVVAAHGGTLEGGIDVQRTFATTRSVEFDVIPLAGCPMPAPDALTARDSKAGGASTTTLDPRVALLVDECYRHAKAIGSWGAGVDALVAAGYTGDEVGVVVGAGADEAYDEVVTLLGAHRVWERFATVED